MRGELRQAARRLRRTPGFAATAVLTIGRGRGANTPIVSVRDAGSLTVSGLRNQAHGEGSATPLDEQVWQVSEWRDGLVVRWQMYTSESEALDAAGLRE